MVDTEGHGRTNHICVVAEVSPPTAWSRATPAPPAEQALGHVYWREAHRLITWDPSEDAVGPSSVRPGNDLDLTKDVRATQAEVGSSTYLVTRSWVKNIVDQCAAHRRADYRHQERMPHGRSLSLAPENTEAGAMERLNPARDLIARPRAA